MKKKRTTVKEKHTAVEEKKVPVSKGFRTLLFTINWSITEPPGDCQEILDAGQNTSGVYTIQHACQNMQVYCRMEPESGKGYIVFQRRLDGSVSFNRTWQEYFEGFGNLTGEFWLGNQKLHSLTHNLGWELVITLRAFDGDEARVRYRYFKMQLSSERKYQLSVGGFNAESGDAGDSLHGHNFWYFSTSDKDYDLDGENCAEKFHGGWWYSYCGSDNFKSNLNGLYYNNATVGDYMGIQWVTWKGKQVSLKGCEMMARPEWITPTLKDDPKIIQTTSEIKDCQNYLSSPPRVPRSS
ncbi:ficolin-1-like [Patiria miniata]|uniref:Fibrinogen C-terminal domain-containing protein n=1 Tax=Patiria miniata TaxID=46514 RepID=A0A914AYS0_PATMI|nr:ficolin-1-like [Patiria miniata]